VRPFWSKVASFDRELPRAGNERVWADPTQINPLATRCNVVMLPAYCPQIAPIVPVLPTMPIRKCCAVYNLRFDAFHGMEEVIGSIPIRSTNKSIT
jgi:hypothetical protein